MAISSKLDALDSLNEVGDSLNALLFMAEQAHLTGTSPEACFVREAARMLNKRAHQVWEIRDYLESSS